MTDNSAPTVPLSKILYVEDDEDIVFITKMSLEDIGKMQVKCCTSGKEALACAASFDPQLFLFDVMMPEMDGVTLLLELRKSPQFAETPVIFLTAKSLSQEIDTYRKLGALDVIIKPFDPTTLAAALQQKWNSYQRSRVK
jgi:two-component system, OmpR family, response regulator